MRKLFANIFFIKLIPKGAYDGGAGCVSVWLPVAAGEAAQPKEDRQVSQATAAFLRQPVGADEYQCEPHFY